MFDLIFVFLHVEILAVFFFFFASCFCFISKLNLGLDFMERNIFIISSLNLGSEFMESNTFIFLLFFLHFPHPKPLVPNREPLVVIGAIPHRLKPVVTVIYYFLSVLIVRNY